MDSRSPFPTPPLKEWERADKMNIEVVGYGWQERRVIVRFHLPKERDTARIQVALFRLTRDMKHSKDWMCEFCGKPSRETHVETLSWQHLDPPRFVIYIHFVCDMDEPHVYAGVKSTHEAINIMNMGRLGPMPKSLGPPRPPGVVYPLAGSCACCERDETSAFDKGASLKKCSKCKLTRYCGADCQKKDWPRHKATCNMIHSVNFENWD